MIAGDSEGLNRRGNVAVIDFGRSHFLRLLAGTGLRCAPRAFAFEDIYLAKHAQGIDPTAGAPARRADANIAGPPVHHVFHGHVDGHDLGDKAARELGCA